MAISQQDVIKKFMYSLDNTNLRGTNAVDAAIQTCSNSKFTSTQAVIDQMISDCASSSSADDFLKNYCGIDLTNSDTGAITGLDAGGSTTAKTAESIIPESGSLKTYTNNSFTVDGLTVELVTFPSSNFNNHYKSTTYSSLTTPQKYIWNALYTWWIPNALELIAESYGSNFGFGSDSSATVKTMHLGFYIDNSNALAFTSTWSNGEWKIVTDLDFKTNMKFYNNINTSNPNGSASLTSLYLDRNIAHEMTHAVMAANIDYFNYLPKIIQEGMAELTHGIDDFRNESIRILAGNSVLLRQALVLSTNSNSMYGVSSPDYAGGYMFLRYLAKQCENADDDYDDNDSDEEFTENGDSYSNYISDTVLSALGGDDTITNDETAINVTIYGGTGKDSIENYGSKTKISGGSGKDTIKNYGDSVIIYGGTGSDYIDNNGGKVKIYGGTGDDTISGGYGNETMKGGTGKDIFIYTGGKDIITDYTAGKDEIKISSSYTVTFSGKDVIFTTSDGTLTVKDGKNKKITVNNSTQKYSSSNIAELFTEDNFLTANNLVEFVENKSVGDIEFAPAQDTVSANITFAQ